MLSENRILRYSLYLLIWSAIAHLVGLDGHKWYTLWRLRSRPIQMTPLIPVRPSASKPSIRIYSWHSHP